MKKVALKSHTIWSETSARTFQMTIRSLYKNISDPASHPLHPTEDYNNAPGTSDICKQTRGSQNDELSENGH